MSQDTNQPQIQPNVPFPARQAEPVAEDMRQVDERIAARLAGLSDPRGGMPDEYVDRAAMRREFEDGQAAQRRYEAIADAGSRAPSADVTREDNIERIETLSAGGVHEAAEFGAAVQAFRDTMNGVEPHHYDNPALDNAAANGALSALDRQHEAEQAANEMDFDI